MYSTDVDKILFVSAARFSKKKRCFGHSLLVSRRRIFNSMRSISPLNSMVVLLTMDINGIGDDNIHTNANHLYQGFKINRLNFRCRPTNRCVSMDSELAR